MITFAVTFVLLALPWEYHIDCSGWTGAAVTDYEMHAVAWDGSIVEVDVTIQPRTEPEHARYPLWRDLHEAGWRVTKVGKEILVVEGGPKSPVRSIEFRGKDWKPDVRMVLKASDKK